MQSKQFVGTWKLVSCEARSPSGKVAYPYGREPFGVLMYDSGGNMSVLIMRRDRPRFASADRFKGTPEEIRAAFEGFVAYCGTYEVNEDEGTVTHHVEGSHFPNMVDTDQVRFFEFSGDQLILQTPPTLLGGEQMTMRLVWRKNKKARRRDPRVIRELLPSDFDSILRVVNDAAKAYRGVIPDDRWKEPYMSAEELRRETEAGVRFYGWVKGNALLGVMGFQSVKDTTLIRHSYVLTKHQRRGIGGKLLKHLMGLARTPEILVGTWEDAAWAIRFYEKHGFKPVPREEKDRLLRKYWAIPDRQIETSVVLKFKR